MTGLMLEVELWCREVLPGQQPAVAAGPLQLLNVRPTSAELAAHPGSLDIQAYFAGARHAAGEEYRPFPRPLTESEAESWRDGFAEHRAERSTSVAVPSGAVAA